MTVNRADFLPFGYTDDDLPVPINDKQTVPSQEITNYMLQALNLQPHETLLEVGTGSGFQTACWAEKCREVVSIECNPVPGVAEKLPRNVVLITASVTNFETDEKFDAIVVTCGIPKSVAERLGGMLKLGGRLVAPIGTSEKQELVRLDKVAGGVEDMRGPLAFCRFLPMELV